MRVQYSRHARTRMIQRNISDDEVEDVIANHHTSYTDETGNAILIGHPRGRRIKVVLAQDRDPPFVITAAD